MRKSQLVALLIISGTLALAACGQKGPLYLTEEQAARAQDAASSVNQDEETEKSKDETTQ